VVLAESPVVGYNGRPSVAHSTYYRQGGMVFAAGTIDWAWALDDLRQRWSGTPSRVDPRLQRVTANVLRAFRQGGPPARAATRPEEAVPQWLLVGLALGAAAALGTGTAWLVLRRRGPQYDPWLE
jgi:ABC-type branched-subunit amino acid transport system permease subunit